MHLWLKPPERKLYSRFDSQHRGLGPAYGFDRREVMMVYDVKVTMRVLFDLVR